MEVGDLASTLIDSSFERRLALLKLFLLERLKPGECSRILPFFESDQSRLSSESAFVKKVFGRTSNLICLRLGRVPVSLSCEVPLGRLRTLMKGDSLRMQREGLRSM